MTVDGRLSCDGSVLAFVEITVCVDLLAFMIGGGGNLGFLKHFIFLFRSVRIFSHIFGHTL